MSSDQWTAFFFALILLISVVLHELAHGVAAYLFGDTTAKRAGRLTLNPIKHIDPVWTILVPLLLYISTHGRFAIGMAKPVPVNFSMLRFRRIGMMVVSFAGPLANLILAVIFSQIWKTDGREFFLFAVYLNLGLAVFNLIPIPPLDGSRVAAALLLPWNLAVKIFRFETWGYLIILLLYFSGVLMKVLVPGVSRLAQCLNVPAIQL